MTREALSEPNMIPIKLEKRYPESKDEDITDAFMQGYLNGKADRPTGEWEDKEVFNETDDDHLVDEWQSARCSVCGKYHTTPFIYYFYNFKFCPNCGAKMYKGGDDE